MTTTLAQQRVGLMARLMARPDAARIDPTPPADQGEGDNKIAPLRARR